MINFDILEKGLGIISSAYFVYDFSRIMFHMLYSINSPNSIVWLPLLLEILGYMCIAIVCLQGCDVINFENNLIFLIKAGPSASKKIFFICFNESLLKLMKSPFLFHHKSSFGAKNISIFCLDFLFMQKKQLD